MWGSAVTDVDERDEVEVRGLYDRLMAGWNEGSGAAFASVFTEGGDLVAFDGTRYTGRVTIEAVQQELFDRWMKGTRLTGGVDSVRFLGPDVAVVHATGDTIARRTSRPARERASVQTLVAVREPAGWRLAAFQNTRVRPIGAGLRTVLLWAVFDRLWRWLRLPTASAPAKLP